MNELYLVRVIDPTYHWCCHDCENDDDDETKCQKSHVGEVIEMYADDALCFLRTGGIELIGESTGKKKFIYEHAVRFVKSSDL